MTQHRALLMLGLGLLLLSCVPTQTPGPATPTIVSPLAPTATNTAPPIPTSAGTNPAASSLIPYTRLTGLGYPIALSPNGRFIATYGRNDVQVDLIEVATGKTLWEFPIPEEDMANSGGLVGENALVFSPDGEWLAVGGNEGIIYLLDAGIGKLLQKQRHTYRVIQMAFASDGQRIMGGSCGDAKSKGLTIWNPVNNSVVHWPVQVCGGKMAIFSRRPFLITSDLTLVNYDTGITETVPLPDRVAAEIALSPDGQILAAYSQDISQGWNNRIAKLELWDLATDTQLSWPTLGQYQTDVLDLAWSTSNVLAILSENGTITAWNGDTQKLVGIAHLEGANYILFSPDGSLLAAGRATRDGPIAIWKLQ